MTKQAIPRLVPLANEVTLGDDARSPIDVLRAQTGYWKDLTKGEILGEVERTITTPDRVAYWFGFVVPSLDGYRYRLFLVEHGLEFYPAWISSGREDAAPVEVSSEEALYAELRKRFSSEKTLRTVRQLHALAEETQAAKAAEEKDGAAE
jgi:hypothetical protein